MQRFRVVSGLCTMAFVLGALLIASPAGASNVADHATVTIHKAECPTGVDDIFDECHDNTLSGVSFDINGFEVGSGTITTDANGVASQTILEAAETGGITVTEDPDVLADYLGAYVYCSEQNSGEVLYDGSADSGSVSFDASQGDDIICDWYNITDDGSAPTATATGGTKLPSTGSGELTGDSSPWMTVVALLAVAAIAGAYGLRRRTI